MNTLALELITKCFETQDPYLDLGRCGLSDEDFAVGSSLDIALRKCTHLGTIVLSNEWFEWHKAESSFKRNLSRNKAGENFLEAPPLALVELTKLKSLVCAGNYDNRWNISTQDLQLIATFKNLVSLNIAYNKISEIKWLESLTALQILNLFNNQISEIKGLDSLTSLQILNISRNSISEIKGLGRITALKTLDISLNQISEIKGLESLTSLNTLNIHDNQISEIKGLKSLAALRALYISRNRISEIKGLKTLSALQIFNIARNRLSDLKGLDSLTDLQALDISSNQISELKGLEKQTDLQILDISDNQIKEIKNLHRLNKLATLNLNGNKISELKNLNKLIKLKELDLSGNPLERISALPLLVERPDLQKLKLFGTGSNNLHIPVELFGMKPDENCLEHLRGYFASLKKGSFQFKELPVILVGNSTAGKTSLRYFLQQNIFPPPEDHSTHGIETSVWVPDDESLENLDPAIKPKDLQLYFWDFGGQEYYHATHRLFYSKKAIYILVWEKKTNKQAVEKIAIRIRKADGQIESTQLPVELFPYEYWLQGIRHLATDANESPVILLQNKTDEAGNEEDDGMNREFLKANNCKAFHLSIKNAYEINGQGRKDPLVDLVLSRIFSEAKNLASTITYGALWEDIKKMLRQVRNENVWSPGKFLSEIRAFDPVIRENSMVSYLLSLRSMGYIIYENDDDLLNQYVFINPGWVTEMIYSILDRSTLENKGEFDKAHVVKKVGKEFTDVLVTLMKKFELIFYNEELDVFIAPQYLPATLEDKRKSNELNAQFDTSKPGFMLQFKSFMPRYIMVRFLVAFGEKAFGKYYWKNGIAFTIEKSSVLVMSDYDKRQFRIYTDNNNRYVERLVFDKLVALGENNNELLVASGDPGFVAYTDLLKEFPGGKFSGNNTIIAIDGTRVSLSHFRDLFDDIEMVNRRYVNPVITRKKLFISYAHDDISYREDLQKFLVNIERDNLIEIWQDGMIKGGDDWDQKIKRSLSGADICILLLSQDFIASNYVHEVEFRMILERRANEQCRIIPVLIKDCDWENWKVYPHEVSKELAETAKKNYTIGTFQFLPVNSSKRMKPLNTWRYQEQAWKQVADAVRKFCTDNE